MRGLEAFGGTPREQVLQAQSPRRVFEHLGGRVHVDDGLPWDDAQHLGQGADAEKLAAQQHQPAQASNHRGLLQG